MVDTHRSAARGKDGGRRDADNDRAHVPPPSPLPVMEQSIAQFLGSQLNMEDLQHRMEETIRDITDNTRQGGNEVVQHSTFKDFLDTEPPVFKEALEPLEAEEWINTMENKFRLLRLTDEIKAEFAAHQLEGPAGIWWTNYCTTMGADFSITWAQFTTAFRAEHILPALMTIKQDEFVKLTQGTKSITEYLHAFNNLSRYAPELVDTEKKKIESFKRGLHPKMAKYVGTSSCTTFNDFVDECLTQENNNNIYAAYKSRKRALELEPSPVIVHMAIPPPYHRSTPSARLRMPPKKYQKVFKPVVPPKRPGQGSSMKSSPCSQPKKKKRTPHTGRVHHTAIEKIPEGEPVATGVFSVNQHLAVVLFDSGSSHSFMSQAFAEKHDQRVTELGSSFHISSAGADVSTRWMVRNAAIEFENLRFGVNLIVLPGLVIDVILGMNWMKLWKTVLDTDSRTLSLTDPRNGGRFHVRLPQSADLVNMSCATQVVELSKTPVVCESPDVFPDELPDFH